MWSDYFEPDFCDPDSPSYVETSPYLPTEHISLIDCQQEVNNVLWDFKDSFRTIQAVKKSFTQRLRDQAIIIDTSDEVWHKINVSFFNH